MRKLQRFFSLLAVLLGLSLAANAQEAAEPDSSASVGDWEHHFMIGLLPGSSAGDFKIGSSVRYGLLYRVRDYLFLGSSAGVGTYEAEAGKTFYPLMLEAKGYFGRVLNWTPYYSAGLGHGFAFRNSWDNVEEAEGGLCWRLGFGLGRPLGKGVKLLLDAGFQYQRGRSLRSFWFNNSDQITEVFQLQRISLRAGLVF